MRKIVALLLAAVMVFSFTACGGGENEEKNSSVIEFEGNKAEYIGSELTKDADGNDAVLVNFKYTNGNEEAKSFFWSFFNSAKQGDAELEAAITWVDEDSFETHVDSTFVDVEPGKSHKVTLAYNIVDRTTPIVITFVTLTDKVLGEITIDPATLKEASGGGSSGLLGEEDPAEAGLVGYYTIDTLTVEGEEVDYDTLVLIGAALNTFVVFNDDGTMLLSVEGESMEFEYVDDGTFFNGFAAGTYVLEGDTITVDIPELGYKLVCNRSDGTPPEVEKYHGGFDDETIARFTGDWHGLSAIYDAVGEYADEDMMVFETVARFTFDEYGDIIPYILFYANGGTEIEDLSLYNMEEYYGMEVYGTFLGKDLHDSEIFMDDYGAVYIMLHIDDGEGNKMSIQTCMRKLDEEWDEENDFPCADKAFLDFYRGKSLEDILEIYGLDPSVLPEMTESPEGTGTAVSGEGIVDFETLETGSVEIAKESERSIVDIETVRHTNEQLITTLDEVLRIQDEGRTKRLAAENEMIKIETELKNKLLEIRK